MEVFLTLGHLKSEAGGLDFSHVNITNNGD